VRTLYRSYLANYAQCARSNNCTYVFMQRVPYWCSVWTKNENSWSIVLKLTNIKSY